MLCFILLLFYAHISRILRGKFSWRKCCIGSDCVDHLLLNQGIDMICSCNVSDIDVWFYSTKNLLALCCLLWPCRFAKGYSFSCSFFTCCRFLVSHSFMVPIYGCENIQIRTVLIPNCSMILTGGLLDLWT